MYRKEIQQYIKEHEQEMLEDVKRLIRINSERMEAEEGKPYGEGPARALKTACDIFHTYGFTSKNHENYVITTDLNDKENKLDILAHLDVVPAGNDWTVTTPFEPVVKDGRLYGRGAADDKGPAIAAFYAIRAVKELKIPMESGVRLILGSDEECGSSDIDYYYKKNSPARMTVSPDADFPVIHIEKGGLTGDFSAVYKKEKELPRIIRLDAGVKINVIPAKAEALIEGLSPEDIKPAALKIEAATGLQFTISAGDTAVRIEAEGTSAHASEPYKGNNALTGLLSLLADLPLADTETNNLIRAIHSILPHGDYYGKALGIDLEDEESGKTTVSFNIFHMNETQLSGCFDCRASLGATKENTALAVGKIFRECGLVPGSLRMYPPHYVPADSELVQALLASYRTVTGRDEKPIASGGGTYVHSVPGGVAFGCAVTEVDNHMHGPDEFMHVEQLLLSAEIYADAIVRLCGKK